MKTAEIVALLDAIDATGDPENAHWEADKLLIAAAPPVVRQAYERVKVRARWWAYA